MDLNLGVDGSISDANMKSFRRKIKISHMFQISLAFSFSKGLTDPEHRFIKSLSFSMEVSDIPQKIVNTSNIYFVLSLLLY